MEVKGYINLEINDIKIPFKHEPYNSQTEMMTKIILALDRRENALLESPTGSGKSLALLSAAICWQHNEKVKEEEEEKKRKNNEKEGNIEKSNVPKIYFGSRTHRQLQQLIQELKQNTQFTPKMTVLGSRGFLCINDSVLQSSNRTDACMELLNHNSKQKNESSTSKSKTGCKYSRPFGDQVNKIVDIEDLVTMGKRLKKCPYYTSRELTQTADIVFAPYNYFVDPSIRRSMDIDLTNGILILDEAHNIEDSCRDAASFTLGAKQLKDVRDVMDGFLFTIIEQFMGEEHVFNRNGFECRSRVWSGTQFNELLKQRGVNQVSFKEAQRAIDRRNQENEDNEISVKQSVVSFAQGLLAVLKNVEFNAKEYQVILSESNSGRECKFLCCDASVTFQQINQITRSIILSSGTLSPMQSFVAELSVPFEHQLEALHVINPRQVFASVIPWNTDKVPIVGTWANTESFPYQDRIANVLLDLTSRIPFGVLCFVPSYHFITNMITRWKNTGAYKQLSAIKPILIEDKNSVDKVLKKHMKLSASGVLTFAVFRGKISEGMDFRDDHARAVISLGIPFPSIKDLQVELKRKYNDSKLGGYSGNEWYECQAFRAINQALGRCIRHRNDWGAIILIEERFTGGKYREKLCRWIRDKIAISSDYDQGLKDLEKFIEYNTGEESKENLSEIESENLIESESQNLIENQKNGKKNETESVLVIQDNENEKKNGMKNANENVAAKKKLKEIKNASKKTKNLVDEKETHLSNQINPLDDDFVAPVKKRKRRFLSLDSKTIDGSYINPLIEPKVSLMNPPIHSPVREMLHLSCSATPHIESFSSPSQIKSTLLCVQCSKPIHSFPILPFHDSNTPLDAQSLHLPFIPIAPWARPLYDQTMKRITKEHRFINSLHYHLESAQLLDCTSIESFHWSVDLLPNSNVALDSMQLMFVNESVAMIPRICKWCIMPPLCRHPMDAIVGVRVASLHGMDQGWEGFKVFIFPQSVTCRNSIK